MYGLAILGWIVLGSRAQANDGDGTLIVTLNCPTLHGAPTGFFFKYDIDVQNLDTGDHRNVPWSNGLFNASPNDLASVGGNGTVVTWGLHPGRYAVTYYDLKGGMLEFFPDDSFSIPFTIRAGRSTYIGSYQPISGTRNGLFGAQVVWGAHFVITDESARDIPIARAKNTTLGPVDVEVFDVDQLNNPLLSMGGAR